MWRITVSRGCRPRCPSCSACADDAPAAGPSLGAALRYARGGEVVLGGGDATRWPELGRFLERATDAGSEVWVEAPARSLQADVLDELARLGAAGVVVQIEATGAAIEALGVGDGEQVIRSAEQRGLGTRARLCVRPKTFPIAVPLALRIAPRIASLELTRRDWGADPVPIWPAQLERAMLMAPNLAFNGQRLANRGYLPPCVLRELWERRPTAWQATFADRVSENTALDVCGRCALRRSCRWSDVGALAAPERDRAEPIEQGRLPWHSRSGRSYRPVPAAVVARRAGREVACVTPWTTMEIVDPDGKVRQCCSSWTDGDRGNAHEQSLTELWNGAGYRAARRTMAGPDLRTLCRPVCPRLADGAFSERYVRIIDGAEPFVANQLAMAEDIAERREVVRANPLKLAICPSTYCNYDCIMCLCGRTPRRELPDEIWAQVHELLPTLQTLTLLGGEPFANPAVVRFLRDFDRTRYPDARVDVVTNGSLLGAELLDKLERCHFGSVTVSVNAGTSEDYERIQRGLSFEQLLANLSDLIGYRDTQRDPFGIALSFVLMPHNADSLLPFAELARARKLDIRLLPLSPRGEEGLDYYDDEDAVAAVLERLDELSEWAAAAAPGWLTEIGASREAIRREAASRRAGADPGLVSLRRPGS